MGGGHLTVDHLTLAGTGEGNVGALILDLGNTQGDDESLEADFTDLTIRDFNFESKNGTGLVSFSPQSWSSGKPPVHFDRLNVERMTFEDNVVDGTNGNLMDALGSDIHYESIKLRGNTVGESLLSLEGAYVHLNDLAVEDNVSSGYGINANYLDDFVTADQTNRGLFELNGGTFTGNTLIGDSNAGLISATGFDKAVLQNLTFADNASDAEYIHLVNDESELRDIAFSGGETGHGLVHWRWEPDSGQWGGASSLLLEDVEVSGVGFSGDAETMGAVLTVTQPYPATSWTSTLDIHTTKPIDWTFAESVGGDVYSVMIDISWDNGGAKHQTDFTVTTDADFTTTRGFYFDGNDNSSVRLVKTGEATFALGGSSVFSAKTDVDVQAGVLALPEEARIVWKNGGSLKTSPGSTLSVALHDVTNTAPADHDALAPLSMNGNSLDLSEESTLAVRVLDPNPQNKEGWLVLAGNAQLTETSNPQLEIADEQNWLYKFTGEGLGLSQGMTDETGAEIEGTGENVYVHYAYEDEVDPDPSAECMMNVTNHFAFVTLDVLQRQLFLERPDRADALWAIPTYVHDRRDNDGFAGYDANLRGITVGRDFVTESGYWGIALGHGDGSLHSVGAIAYTAGDLQSNWAMLYGEWLHEGLRVNGTLAYLRQDADETQGNVAGELRTDTENEAIRAGVTAGYGFDFGDVRAEPSVGFAYTHLKQRDFSVEAGASQAEVLAGEDASMDVWSVPAHVTLSTQWSGSNGTRHAARFLFGGQLNFGDDAMAGRYRDALGRDAGEWRLLPLDDWQLDTGLAYTIADDGPMTFAIQGNFTWGAEHQTSDVSAVVRWLL